MLKKFRFIVLCLLCQVTTMAQWNTDRILTIGQNALYYQDYVLSIQYFNQVINIKPYLPEPYIFRASAKIQLGDFAGAEQDCNEALDKNPFKDFAYYLRGFSREKLEKHYDAINDFTKALEFKPNDSTYLINRIVSYEKLKDYNQAINDIDYLLKLYPQKYDWYYYKGNYLLQLNDTIEAEKCFNNLIDLKKNSYLGWSARGVLRMIRNDDDGALNDLNEAIKCNSTYAGDYVNRGNINNKNRNYSTAINDYNNAIKYDSTEYLAYFNRGLLRGFLGDNNNSLTDFTKAHTLDSTKTEALLQKAIIEKTLGDYTNARNDFKKILKIYPYFIPAYQELANIEEKVGNKKLAFLYLKKAENIALNKDYFKNKANDNLTAKNKMVVNTQKTYLGNKNKLFYQIAMQNNIDSTNIYQENNSIKGAVQDKFTNLINETDFILSFITFKYQYRRTNLYHTTLNEFNKMQIVPIRLGISNIELPITSELTSVYFTAINITTDSINTNKTNPYLYFSRALEFTAIKDYIGALDDLNEAIKIKPDFMLAIFAKANIENKLSDKQIELKSNLISNDFNSTILKNIDLNKYVFSKDSILNLYEKVLELNPDFSFAYYNKGNILCTQKDFRTALSNFTKAIQIDPDFAEAYFNRGLTYLFIGEDAKGLADLSKAGELGIYKAYNLIQRFKK